MNSGFRVGGFDSQGLWREDGFQDAGGRSEPRGIQDSPGVSGPGEHWQLAPRDISWASFFITVFCFFLGYLFFFFLFARIFCFLSTSEDPTSLLFFN